MVYFFAKFGFCMLGGAFVSSFLSPALGISFGIVFLFAAAGFGFLNRRFIGASALFLAVFLGMTAVSVNLMEDYYPAKALDGLSGEITGIITEVSAGGGNPTYTVKTESIGIEGAKQELKIQLSGWGESSAKPFDRIRCEAAFLAYSESLDENFLTDRSGGISLYAYTLSPIEIIGAENSSFEYFIFQIQSRISSVIYSFFIDWHAPFMEQLIIGKRGNLDYEITSAFRQSGMSHILAISGMHMVIIIGLFEKLFFYRGGNSKSEKLKALVLIAITALYVFIGGFGISVLRSGAMLITHYLTKLFFAGSKSVDNLGIAVSAILLSDPMACCDTGFLLSVAACCSISVFSEPFENFINKILHIKDDAHAAIRFFTKAFACSSVAFLGVLPITALIFREISIVSPISNIFSGILAQGALIFGVLTVILGLLPFGGFFAGGTAAIAMVFSGALFSVAKFFSSPAFSYIAVDEIWVIFWLFGAAVLIIAPALQSRSFRYMRYSIPAAVFALLFGIAAHLIFFSGVAKIEITALEHGTAVSCSEDGYSVLVTHGLGPADSYDLVVDEKKCELFISLEPEEASAEISVCESLEPNLALLSESDSLEQYDRADSSEPKKVFFGEESYIEILSEKVFSAKFSEASVLYISGECDIMDIEPEFRRADIIILDGISPEKFPVLRSEYLILRKMGGFYSGTTEIIVLKEGKTEFYAYKGNIRKGWNAG